MRLEDYMPQDSHYIQAKDCRELPQHFGKRTVVSAAMRLTTDGSQ